MHRFYCLSQNINGDQATIEDKEQLHHACDVLRLKKNGQVIIFDEKGNEYTSLIREITNKMMVLEIKNKRLPTISKIKITVACAIPKKSKFDDIVDKLTQLGAERIVPLLTQRVIVKWDKPKMALQQKRWEKIAFCASQQSQRSVLPIIEPIKNIREVLSASEVFDLKLIPALIGRRKSLKEIFAQFKPKNILVLIGPEGDFTPGEVELAVKAGCIPVSLGELVLRVDMAAIAVASFIRLYANH